VAAAVLSPSLDRRARPSLEAAGGQLGLLAVLVVAGATVAVPALTRPVLTVALATTFGVLAIVRPHRSLLALFAWLLVLGSVRRIVTGVSPAGETDLLLLVGPVALVSLVVASKPLRAHLVPTRLSQAVLVLSVVVFASALNPAQGSLLAGVAGLLFTFLPMLAFWIGRSLPDRVLLRLLQLVVVGGIGAAIYGLFQQFVGFPWWDVRWVAEAEADGYISLNVGNGITRAFASFASSQEYAAVLMLGIVLAGVFHARRLPVFLLLAGPMAVALVVTGSRTPIVLVLMTGGLLVATRLRLPLPLVVAAGAACFVLVFVGASHLAQTTATSGTAAPFVDRQLEGLANPLDAEKSTATAHYGYFVEGVRAAFTDPIGHGLGVISVAGSKFGGDAKLTEYDPSNMAVAAGLPGLLAYLAVALLGLRNAYRLARARPGPLALAAFGVLLVMFTQWMNGGLYAISMLPWLALGWADRQGAASDRGGPGPSDGDRDREAVPA
jgi:hypothetical protein